MRQFRGKTGRSLCRVLICRLFTKVRYQIVRISEWSSGLQAHQQRWLNAQSSPIVRRTLAHY